MQRLRELHAAMDRAALEVYGRQDLAARAEPIFLDETNEDDHAYQGCLFGHPTFVTRCWPTFLSSTPHAMTKCAAASRQR